MFDHNYIRKRGNVALNENFIITAGFCWDVMLENRFKNSLYLLESKKFYIIKKPGNPSRLLTYPVAPELFALYAIPVVFP